jgi:hypothetical protein
LVLAVVVVAAAVDYFCHPRKNRKREGFLISLFDKWISKLGRWKIVEQKTIIFPFFWLKFSRVFPPYLLLNFPTKKFPAFK